IGGAIVALAGELISPNRGLLIYTPIVLFSIVGAIRAARIQTRDAARLVWLAGASVVLLLGYAFYPLWFGGWTYGPRFLTDTMPVACLLLVYAIPASRVLAVPFALLLAASIGVQI